MMNNPLKSIRFVVCSKYSSAIGKSGCGKSTLAKLIAGLYQLQSGNIRFGAYNQQDINLDCLRQQVVLIPHQRVINKADWIIMLEKGQLKCEGLREILVETEGEHLEFLSF